MKVLEEAPMNKYRYEVDSQDIEGNIYGHSMEEARVMIAKKYGVKPEEVNIYKIGGVGYRS